MFTRTQAAQGTFVFSSTLVTDKSPWNPTRGVTILRAQVPHGILHTGKRHSAPQGEPVLRDSSKNLPCKRRLRSSPRSGGTTQPRVAQRTLGGLRSRLL